MKLSNFTLGLSLVFVIGSVQASPITLDEGSIVTTGRDCTGLSVVECGSVVTDVYYTSDLNDVTTRSLALGPSTASTQIAWQDLGSSQLFKFAFEMERSAAFGSLLDSYTSPIFTVTQNATYTIDGTFGMIGDGRLAFRVQLIDMSLGGAVLVSNSQDSVLTANESFVLGETSGDSSNYMAGSLTGNLINGHEYEFWYYAFISHSDFLPTESIANSSGSVNLMIQASDTTGDSNRVPEPGSNFLVVIGLLGLVVSRRNRKAFGPLQVRCRRGFQVGQRPVVAASRPRRMLAQPKVVA